MIYTKQVIVSRLALRSEPSFKSPLLNKVVFFGERINGKNIIHYENDFNYLETIWNHQKVYLPTQYLRNYDSNSIPLDYVPHDLVLIPEKYTSPNHKISLCYEAFQKLQKLLELASSQGIHLKIIHGYRSIHDLSKTFQASIETSFLQKTLEKPSDSPYCSGNTVDLSSCETNYEQDDPHFYFTKAFQWLQLNSWKFNFYCYTPLNLLTSDIPYKPWQFRYQPLHQKNNILNLHLYDNHQIHIFKKSFCFYQKKRGNSPFTYIILYDNEKVAKNLAQYALNYYGGTLYKILNKNQRTIKIQVENCLLRYDPNCIFTKTGTINTIKQNNLHINDSYILKKAATQVQTIGRNFFNHLSNSDPNSIFITLHTNNRYNSFSIDTFKKKNVFVVHQNQKHHKKNFFYVLKKSEFLFFKNKSYNVVWQKKKSLLHDDGSLSIAMYNSKKQYLSIEIIEGFLTMAKEMLDICIHYFNVSKY